MLRIVPQAQASLLPSNDIEHHRDLFFSESRTVYGACLGSLYWTRSPL